MRLILLGAPGAGKGTQAELLSEKLNVPQISTGDIIRGAIKSGSQLGLKIKEYSEKGLLVPDEIVVKMVKDRLSKDDCENGFILDGFPRTVPQGKALDEMGVEIDAVLSIEVTDKSIIDRISGRRQCPKCGATYHLEYKKPKNDAVCDFDGSELIIRKDDAPETVKKRLDVYHNETAPLKDFYDKKGILKIAYGQEEIKDTTKEVLKALEV